MVLKSLLLFESLTEPLRHVVFSFASIGDIRLATQQIVWHLFLCIRAGSFQLEFVGLFISNAPCLLEVGLRVGVVLDFASLLSDLSACSLY